MPSHRQNEPDFSMDRYKASRGEVLLHMSHFFLGYLNTLYQTFDGDLALVIVFGEISHHNTARFFSSHELDNEQIEALQNQSMGWDKMEGCNAYSLSCSTGIPRETVRRKIAYLIKRGWVVDVPEQGLRITPACSDHFGPDFSVKILKELLKASRAIEHILKRDSKDATPSAATASKSPPQKNKTTKKTTHKKSKP